MIIALGLQLKVATIILGCIFSMLFSYFRDRGPTYKYSYASYRGIDSFSMQMQMQWLASIHCQYRDI